MKATVVLPEAILEAIDTVSRDTVETAGVLLADVVCAPNGDTRVLGRAIRWIDEGAYTRRTSDELLIRSEGYVPILAEAAAIGSAALWVHTHPGERGRPIQSKLDQKVDREIADLFRIRSGSDYYGALIFSPRQNGVVFGGYIEMDGEKRIPLDRLLSVGSRLRLTRAFDTGLRALSSIFDRNVRALGQAVQETLGDLHIGLVGCGGTGSAVAEQLARLGVRTFTLIDPDHLSASNLTRVYGSAPTDIGVHKVRVVANHLRRIAPDAVCDEVPAMVTLEQTARRLTACDVIFGCTDDNAGRLVLSRVASYLLTPVIDCGVLLTSGENDMLSGIDGRVTTLTPGQACLVCRGRIDLRRAAAELLTPEERQRREDEGYAPALGRTEPAVVAFTTLVAAAAVGELLERLIGYGPEPRPSEMLLRLHDRETSTNIVEPRTGHYCDPASGKLGAGNTAPFLGQMWPT